MDKGNIDAAARKAAREKERQKSTTMMASSAKAGVVEMPARAAAGAEALASSKLTPPPSLRGSEAAHPFMVLLTPPGGAGVNANKLTTSSERARGSTNEKISNQRNNSGALGLEEKLRAAEAMLLSSSASGGPTSSSTKAKSNNGSHEQSTALSPRNVGKISRGPPSTSSSNDRHNSPAISTKGRENTNINTKTSTIDRTGTALRKSKVTFSSSASGLANPTRTTTSMVRSPRRTKTVKSIAGAETVPASTTPSRAKKSQTGPKSTTARASAPVTVPTTASGTKVDSAQSTGDKKFAETNPFHFATREL